MISLLKHSKLLGILPKPLPQAVKINVQADRTYVERKGDEDIKWQWAVRESPCQLCHKVKKGWISKMFKRKNADDGLTNRRKEVKYVPKFWEMEYYSYLLPNCNKKISLNINKSKLKQKKRSDGKKFAVCGPKNDECKGKQILVHIKDGRELKTCTEKLDFQFKEPFCLNEVCGKIKPAKTENQSDDKAEFLCLNHLIENKQKSGDDSKDPDKKDCCDR